MQEAEKKARRYWSIGEDAMLNGTKVHVQDTDFLNQQAKVGVAVTYRGHGETRTIVPDAEWVDWDELQLP